jgi:peptidoglycan/xylan/chitin deacetylase (PgdA/CDA1 family)
MNLVRIPGILKKAFPGITWEVKSEKPALYLTFDDGPTPGVTHEVLKVLDRYRAAATFFCIGRNVERHPDIYRQMLAAGHTAGNHTYSHLKGWFTRDREYYLDISLAAQFIQSDLYRPAYGMITPRQLRHLKKTYTVVLWDIMSYDFAYNTTPEQCLKQVLRHARPGSVIVFHDSVKASEKLLYALPRLLDYFGEKGYSFESIPHC